jgi:hypothetical protein
LSATYTFGSTQSQFYGDMRYKFTDASMIGYNYGAAFGCHDFGALGSSIPVPQQQITYNFTAIVLNSPPAAPAAPTISGSCHRAKAAAF